MHLRHRGQAGAGIVRAAQALEALDPSALAPFAQPVIKAYSASGDVAGAYRVALSALKRTPADLELLEVAFDLASKAGTLPERLELGRELSTRQSARDAGKTPFRALSKVARGAGDAQSAANLLVEALRAVPPSADELEEVLGVLREGGQVREAALRAAQFTLEAPADVSRWMRLKGLAEEAREPALLAAAGAVEAFLAGKSTGGAQALDPTPSPGSRVGSLRPGEPRFSSAGPSAGWRQRPLRPRRNRARREPAGRSHR